VNFLNYLLKAKGRHGTHSPYIYKFVEDALHENNALTWDYPKDIAGGKARTLFRVLSYLSEAEQLIATAAVMQRDAWLQHFNPAIIVPDEIVITKPSIILLSLEEMEQQKEVFLTKEIAEGSVILIAHPGNPNYSSLEVYFQQECFNATIFTWDFSLLMNRPDFKRKQHFILR